MEYYDNPYAMQAVTDIIWTVICLVSAVLIIAAWWKVFSKSGEAGWKAVVPFYNVYTAFRIFWKRSVFFVMLALSVCMAIGYFILTFALIALLMYGSGSGNIAALIIGLVFTAGAGIAALILDIILQNRLSRAFGHGTGFTIGLVLLRPVFMMILGFGRSEHIVSPDDRKVSFAAADESDADYTNPME